MNSFKVGDKGWAFLSNLINECSLDIISTKTTFLHEWLILAIDDDRCFVEDCMGLVIPRTALVRDLYKTKKEAIEAMKLRLEELSNE